VRPETMTWVMLWSGYMAAALIAITAIAVWPVAVRYERRRAQHRAEHDIVQACLWADTPMQVLEFYGRYRPSPPTRPPLVDFPAYTDDQIAKDPALERLTRHPDPGTAELARFLIRPAAPSDPVENQEHHPVSPAEMGIGPRPAATSHRAMRRPVVGWWEESRMGKAVARWRDRAEPVPDAPPPAGNVDIEELMDGADLAPGLASTDRAPGTLNIQEAPEQNHAPAEQDHTSDTPSDGIPADIPPPPDGEINTPNDAPPDPLLGVATPTLCPRCKGTTRITAVDGTRLWIACPDCCCTEPGCGRRTSGGLCDEHQHADDLRAEDAGKRMADV
jgi:hypothetical protein